MKKRPRGLCSMCCRDVAATKAGRAWRHGHTRLGRGKCLGSGYPVLPRPAPVWRPLWIGNG